MQSRNHWFAFAYCDVHLAAAGTVGARARAIGRVSRAWAEAGPVLAGRAAQGQRARWLRGARRTLRHRLALVGFPLFSDVVRERVVRVGRGEQRLDRQQDGADLQRRAPLVLENVKADAAQFVDVRVVHFGEEADLWRRHRVILGEKELQFENTTWREASARGTAHRRCSSSSVGGRAHAQSERRTRSVSAGRVAAAVRWRRGSVPRSGENVRATRDRGVGEAAHEEQLSTYPCTASHLDPGSSR